MSIPVWMILAGIAISIVYSLCICIAVTKFITYLCRRAKKRLRGFRERHCPDRRSSRPSPSGGDQQSESAPSSADDQQPSLSPAPVNDHQPHQQESQLSVYSITGYLDQSSNPSAGGNIGTPPSYSDVTSPPQGPAPPPPIPPPSYSDVTSPPQGPAPPPPIPSPSYSDVTSPPPIPPPSYSDVMSPPPIPPPSYSGAMSPLRRKQWKRRPAPPPPIPPPPYSDVISPTPIPPPSYSDVMSLPLYYRYTRDSDPGRGQPYTTHM